MRRMKMTLEDALDMVLKQAEWSIDTEDPLPTKALELVEDAVLRYMKIEKEFDKLQDIINKKEIYSRCVYSEHELNGKASIVVKDDNVRAES
jgi:hypothetical protein